MNIDDAKYVSFGYNGTPDVEEFGGKIVSLNKSAGVLWVIVLYYVQNNILIDLRTIDWITHKQPFSMEDIKNIKYYEVFKDFCAEHFTEIV